jgi:hypothetical protein
MAVVQPAQDIDEAARLELLGLARHIAAEYGFAR